MPINRKKIKLTSKHYKLKNHFLQFLDKRWYSNFIVTDEILEIFVYAQSYGFRDLTELESKLIEPLINAQQLKEIQIKALVEDIGLFWSNGWGWYIPLMDDIKNEYKARHIHKDILYIQALIKIARNIKTNGIVNFIKNYTGHSNEWKSKILSTWILNH